MQSRRFRNPLFMRVPCAYAVPRSVRTVARRMTPTVTRARSVPRLRGRYPDVCPEALGGRFPGLLAARRICKRECWESYIYRMGDRTCRALIRFPRAVAHTEESFEPALWTRSRTLSWSLYEEATREFERHPVELQPTRE
jgi:hypothetical protein